MTKFQRYSALCLVLASPALLPSLAQAEPRIYAYESSANYCPSGLQPITINGVICCGTPNQSTSYQDMMRHGSSKRRSYVSTSSIGSKGMVCPEGEKGCYTQ